MQIRGGHRSRLREVFWIGTLAALGTGVAMAYNPIPTTLNDFFLKGTQPLFGGQMFEPMQQATDNCSLCHGGYNETTEPYTRWTNSLMAQAARDPIFHACMTIANQDAAFAGDTCLRCHTAMGWIEGRSFPTDGSALGGYYDPDNQVYEFPGDFEGVSCSVCHRMVDPAHPASSPAEDAAILAALTGNPVGNGVPPNPGSANYVIDWDDRRRGPLDLSEHWGANFIFHYWLESPFHLSSRMCATCHDVSNPLYTRQPDGSYSIGSAANPGTPSYDTPHESQSKHDMFPMERTFSEWSASLFAAGPVDMGEFPAGSGQPRYGGNTGPLVSSCQNCHMPTTSGTVCAPFSSPPNRPVIPQHNFNGVNSWVLRAVDFLYPPTQTGLTGASVDAAIGRNTDMMQRASDLELSVVGASLNARIINMTGHKLPTGYHEGRRMWVNVKFYNGANQLIGERGAYDAAEAELNTADTKVYEAAMGVDAAVAALTGLPVGPSFHFALNNKVYFDNRIPPMGYSHAAFDAVQAAPVAYAYADGQYWDDTLYAIPPLAASATVSVYHQTTSREYIEFLRDANVTNSAGQVAYNMWVQFGKSAPTLMDQKTIATGRCTADWDGNGQINPSDVAAYVTAWFSGVTSGSLYADMNADGVITPADVAQFVSVWFNALSGPCP